MRSNIQVKGRLNNATFTEVKVVGGRKVGEGDDVGYF
jgi:hypothetical protein